MPGLGRGLSQIFAARGLVIREAPSRAVEAEFIWEGAAVARFLLEGLTPAEGERVLWVVDCPLADGLHPSLAGAAMGRVAAVHAGWPEDEAGLLSVAGHEVGHLLGLAHCRGGCLMHPVTKPRDVRHRPLRLCAACRDKL